MFNDDNGLGIDVINPDTIGDVIIPEADRSISLLQNVAYGSPITSFVSVCDRHSIRQEIYNATVGQTTTHGYWGFKLYQGIDPIQVPNPNTFGYENPNP